MWGKNTTPITFRPSVDSLCHRWVKTINLSYRFPIFETSATAFCGTTGICPTIYCTRRAPAISAGHVPVCATLCELRRSDLYQACANDVPPFRSYKCLSVSVPAKSTRRAIHSVVSSSFDLYTCLAGSLEVKLPTYG